MLLKSLFFSALSLSLYGGGIMESVESKRDKGVLHEEQRFYKIAKNLGFSPKYLSVFFQELGGRSAKKILGYRDGVIFGLFEAFHTDVEKLNSVLGHTKKEDLHEVLFRCSVSESSLTISINLGVLLNALPEVLLSSSDDPFIQGISQKRKECMTLYYEACKNFYEERVASKISYEKNLEAYVRVLYKEGIKESQNIMTLLKEKHPEITLDDYLSASKDMVSQFVNKKISAIHREALHPFRINLER